MFKTRCMKNQMQEDDFHLLKLLEFHLGEGKIFCEDERMLVFTASSFGSLQDILIKRFGVEEARTVISQFGYRHGFHSCLTAEQVFGESHKVTAAVRYHEVAGFGKYENTKATEPPAKYHFESDMHDSAEAEQFIANFGRSSFPVCWWTTGFASGYCSAHFRAEVYVKEVRCVAQGASTCELLGNDTELWLAEAPLFRSLFGFANAKDAEKFRTQQYELHRKWHIERTRTRDLHNLSSSGLRDSSVRSKLEKITEASGFIIREKAMWLALERAMAVARLDTPVLVHGETGTGKELVVNLIHNQSARSRRSLLSINCAAVTETLLESELFGHVRGAFTGAVSDKQGLFEAASQGTLFLDEIGEMPLSLQAKLLRVLENGEVRRVGSTQIIRVSPRILAATNRDLPAMVEKGEFRLDLYFRLNSFVIDLPPLRERRDSIPPLVQLFVEQTCCKFGKHIKAVSPEAMSRLTSYEWPGNVRELKHAVESAIIVATSTVIEVSDLPTNLVRIAKTKAARGILMANGCSSLRDGERQVILDALQAFGGNRTATAKALNIHISTLWRKMRRLGLLSE